VAVGPHGDLYATEATGGTYGEGSVVKLAPPQAPGGAWTQTLIYSFGCCNESAPGNPDNLTIGSDGPFTARRGATTPDWGTTSAPARHFP
jgi:hypothetical protein